MVGGGAIFTENAAFGGIQGALGGPAVVAENCGEGIIILES
jgi:hypothetical protein